MMDRRSEVALAAMSERRFKSEEVKKWNAEWENASARKELARRDANAALIISQHHPCADLGINRVALSSIFSYLRHGDLKRLWRELELEE